MVRWSTHRNPPGHHKLGKNPCAMKTHGLDRRCRCRPPVRKSQMSVMSLPKKEMGVSYNMDIVPQNNPWLSQCIIINFG